MDMERSSLHKILINVKATSQSRRKNVKSNNIYCNPTMQNFMNCQNCHLFILYSKDNSPFSFELK